MRIELTTLGLLDPRSNQLSYEAVLLNLVHIELHKYYLSQNLTPKKIS